MKIRKLKVLINQLPANKIRAQIQTPEIIHRIEFVNRKNSCHCCWCCFFFIPDANTMKTDISTYDKHK